MPRRKSGVRLSTSTDGVRVEAHVHVAHDGWTITSRTPVDESLLTVDVLDRLLPGPLGCFVLPADAVFNIDARERTSSADLNGSIATYSRMTHRDSLRDMRLNHMTIANAMPPEEDALDDDDAALEDGGGEEEEGGEDNDVEDDLGCADDVTRWDEEELPIEEGP